MGTKIKNKTKAKLIMEFSGQPCDKVGKDKFLFYLPLDDGLYYKFKNQYVYRPIDDGTLSPIFSVSDLGDLQLTWGELYVTEKYIVCFKLGCHNELLKTKIEAEYLRYKNNNLIYKTILHANKSIVFDNGGFIGTNGDYLCEYDNECKLVWQYEVCYLHVQPQLYKNFIYLHYEKRDKNESAILKLNRNGEVVSRLDIKQAGGCHWKRFQFDNDGNIYYGCSISDKDNPILFCLNNDLEIISEIDTGKRSTSFDGLLDPASKYLFMMLYDQGLIAVDTINKKVIASREYKQFEKLCCIDLKGNLVVHKTGSTLEILDQSLNLLSHHQLKGTIYDSYYNKNGNVCILTGNNDSFFFGRSVVTGKREARVYELTY